MLGMGLFLLLAQVVLFELVVACFTQMVLLWNFGGLKGCGVGDEAFGLGGDGDGG